MKYTTLSEVLVFMLVKKNMQQKKGLLQKKTKVAFFSHFKNLSKMLYLNNLNKSKPCHLKAGNTEPVSLREAGA